MIKARSKVAIDAYGYDFIRCFVFVTLLFGHISVGFLLFIWL